MTASNTKINFQKSLENLLIRSNNLPDYLLRSELYNNPNTLEDYEFTKKRLFQIIDSQKNNDHMLFYASETIRNFFCLMPCPFDSCDKNLAETLAEKRFATLMKNYALTRSFILFSRYRDLIHWLRRNTEYQWFYIQRFNDLANDARPRGILEQVISDRNLNDHQWSFIDLTLQIQEKMTSPLVPKNSSMEEKGLNNTVYGNSVEKSSSSTIESKSLVTKDYNPKYFGTYKRPQENGEASQKKMKIEFLCDPMLSEPPEQKSPDFS